MPSTVMSASGTGRAPSGTGPSRASFRSAARSGPARGRRQGPDRDHAHADLDNRPHRLPPLGTFAPPGLTTESFLAVHPPHPHAAWPPPRRLPRHRGLTAPAPKRELLPTRSSPPGRPPLGTFLMRIADVRKDVLCADQRGQSTPCREVETFLQRRTTRRVPNNELDERDERDELEPGNGDASTASRIGAIAAYHWRSRWTRTSFAGPQGRADAMLIRRQRSSCRSTWMTSSTSSTGRTTPLDCPPLRTL